MPLPLFLCPLCRLSYVCAGTESGEFLAWGRFGDLQTETAKEAAPATTDPKLLAREKRFKAQQEAAAAAEATA